jgi:hypothetical protein
MESIKLIKKLKGQGSILYFRNGYNCGVTFKKEDEKTHNFIKKHIGQIREITEKQWTEA